MQISLLTQSKEKRNKEKQIHYHAYRYVTILKVLNL